MISIIVPTFRRETLLAPLFQSVEREASTLFCSMELVLVDNSPEASAQAAASSAPDFVRYVHEPQTGVAQARNRGVAEAMGSHVVFLDDDERPEQGWLAAFSASAARGDLAAFGSIEPVFLSSPPEHLRGPLERVFSRRLTVGSGQDAAKHRAYLGSGNSMFRRDILDLEKPPFDPAFDNGGEDIWLFRKLVDRHGIALIWCPEARVHEIVPNDRATVEFLRRRRFSDGQLRCLVESGAGGLQGTLRVAFWMAVGTAQVVLCGLAAIGTQSFSKARSTRFQLAAAGGVGKILWWKRRLTK